MNIVTIDQKTGQPYLLGRSLRFWIITGIVVTLLFILMIVMLNFALVRISYDFAPEARRSAATIGFTNLNNQPVKPLMLPGGLALLPRSAAAVSVKTDTSETLAAVENLPFIGITNIPLSLRPQNQVSKIGADSAGCNMINQTGAYTYNCSSVNDIQRFNRPDDGFWDLKPARTGAQDTAYARYLDGFLTVEYPIEDDGEIIDSPGLIRYVVPGGSTVSRTLPEGFTKSKDDIVTITTNQANAADTTILLINLTTGEMAVASDWNHLSQPTRIAKQDDTDTRFDTILCTVSKIQITCYRGPNTVDHIDEEGNEEAHKKYRESHQKGKIETISLSDITQRNTYSISALEGIDSLYQATDGTLFAQSDQVLYLLSLQNSKLTSRVVSTNVGNLGASNNSLFYTMDNGLYEYVTSEKSSYLRFRTKNLRTGSLSVYGNAVIFTAFQNVSDDNEDINLAHAFMLTSKVLGANEKRKEDILPYQNTDLPITFMDYDDDRIYVNLLPVYQNSNGARSIDQTATLARSQSVIDKLRQDGLANGMKLLFE